MVVALGNCAERIGGWGERERECAATHQGGAGSRDGPGQGVRLKGAIRVGRGRIRAHETDRSLERQEGLAQKQRREDADEACDLAKIEKDGQAPVHDLRELGRRVRQATDDGPDELVIHDTHDARVRVPGGGARGSAHRRRTTNRDDDTVDTVDATASGQIFHQRVNNGFGFVRAARGGQHAPTHHSCCARVRRLASSDALPRAGNQSPTCV